MRDIKKIVCVGKKDVGNAQKEQTLGKPITKFLSMSLVKLFTEISLLLFQL